MLISVIVTTFNRPKALTLVLLALNNQTDKHFEVIVADDGSGEETQVLIDSMKTKVSYPLMHVWQKDKGFRAALARNKAVLISSGEYLIFLDGDCVPLPNWVSRHRVLAEDGWMVAGNRILLSSKLTQTVESRIDHIFTWGISKWIYYSFMGLINRWVPLIFVPLGFARKMGSKKWKKVRTCNFGVWRRDFFAVNGFDSSFEGWGFEDSDLAVRLINSGVRRKLGVYSTAVLHLWHREYDRSQTGRNNEILLERIRSKKIESTTGLKQLTH